MNSCDGGVEPCRIPTKSAPDWQDESYPVHLDWTDCNLGGKRPWFLCPARGCGRWVALLYGGGIFACRHRYQLAYPSQREAGYNRMARCVNRLRAKLSWELGCLNGPGGKPKGMHWSTFERLAARHGVFVRTSLIRIGKLGDFSPLKRSLLELF